MPHISCLPSYFVSRHTTLQGKETCGKRKKETKAITIHIKMQTRFEDVTIERQINEWVERHNIYT